MALSRQRYTQMWSAQEVGMPFAATEMVSAEWYAAAAYGLSAAIDGPTTPTKVGEIGGVGPTAGREQLGVGDTENERVRSGGNSRPVSDDSSGRRLVETASVTSH